VEHAVAGEALGRLGSHLVETHHDTPLGWANVQCF
jgi:hypothetical protein